MNKTAIKIFSIWARNKLIADIVYKAGLLGITEQGISDPLPQSTSEAQFFDIGTKDYVSIGRDEMKQRDALVSAIRRKEGDTNYAAAFHYVVEKTAYTWFNRLIAIRFMEVNDYLPSRVRVLSSENGSKAEPDIVTRPFDTDWLFTMEEQDAVTRLKDENSLDELFRILFIKQCHALHEVLPGLFDADSLRSENCYLELLLTISFTDKDGVVWRLVHDIPEKDFRIRTPEDDERQRAENIPEEDMPAGQVEIIGWLYQYYNTEPKDQVFANLKKNIKVSKDNIPAATQLFTPDWIVRYMVENSLGRIFSEQWLVGSGQSSDQWLVGSGQNLTTNHSPLITTSEEERIAKETEIAEKMGWKYYLPEAEQSSDQWSVGSDHSSGRNLTTNHYSLTTLKVIDPCMGSGHILVYLFDVLMQIYESQGWSRREAVQSIVENNLWGLDIDERAAQLAYFAVMMKACQYDRRFLRRGIQPHVYAIAESNGVESYTVDYFCKGDAGLKKAMNAIVEELHDAKEYGSLLTVTPQDWSALYARFDEIEEEINFSKEAALALKPIVQTAQALSQKYHTVCTNPPYMGSSNMGSKLSDYVKKNYPDSKSDLFAVFIERCGQMTGKNGYQAMITQHAWMFLSSFEKLRGKLLLTDTINMVHLGARAFEEIGGEVVQTTSFVLRKSHTPGYKGVYCRLIEPNTQQGKEGMFLAGENRYIAIEDNFFRIPGSPVVYWVSEAFYKAFEHGALLEGLAHPRKGLATTDNNRFLRLWHEVFFSRCGIRFSNADAAHQSGKKWFPLNKGGEYRRWYGNKEYVVNWEDNGAEMKAAIIKRYNGGSYTKEIRSENKYFSDSITWSALTAGDSSFRFSDYGALFDSAGSSMFPEQNTEYILGLLNTKVANEILRVINPTLNYGAGSIANIPIVIDDAMLARVNSVVRENISISRADWDSFETSWDFKKHPLVRPVSTVAEAFAQWQEECETRFQTLKANEEELNRIFIDIYGLQDELTPEEEDKDVTVRRADLGRDVRSLISYAVGCMFGRYSLDVDGLAYAGGDFNDQWVGISDQWAVGSGQSLTTNHSPLTTNYYKREVVEYYVGQELSRAYGMAEVDGLGNGDIPTGETTAERGIVFTFGANAESGSINPFQYRRGSSKKLYKGIHKLSVDCQGVKGGTGNPAFDLCSPEILDAISSGNSAELVRRGWEDADCIDWETIRSVVVSDQWSEGSEQWTVGSGQNLATNHYSLFTIHYPLSTTHYCPDADNCIPITDEPYFEDDIVSRFVEFIRVVYGAETLEENLSFITQALGNKGNGSRDVIRNYFLNDFMKDHMKIYQKRPIYWLFDSGKQNGFKALVYMHRWNADTVGNLRVEYLHRTQRVYEKEIERMQDTIAQSKDSREVARATKRREKLTKQLKETRDYDTKIAHVALSRVDIDLDDGVKVNYEKVQKGPDGKSLGILAKM